MKTPETSKLFKRVTDKVSGVPYYVLAERKTAYQQGFYFVNNSMSHDGRYLWFYAVPNPVYDDMNRYLGYVDFLTDEVVTCYDALFDATSPYVDPDTVNEVKLAGWYCLSPSLNCNKNYRFYL